MARAKSPIFETILTNLRQQPLHWIIHLSSTNDRFDSLRQFNYCFIGLKVQQLRLEWLAMVS